MTAGCDSLAAVQVADPQQRLTPAQEDTLDLIRATGDTRPEVDPMLRHRLREQVEDELRPLADALHEPVFVGKRDLRQVLSCEAHHEAERLVPFEWSVPAARGTVAHKAIELSINRHDAPPPLDLADAAVARLRDDPEQSIAGFLLGLDPDELAELRSSVADVVGKFQDLWPPLRRAWKPQTESAMRASFCGDRVQVRGKVDLTLGAPRGLEAGRLVVDLKTGGRTGAHRDDLRLYALLDTLRTGVPPFRLVGYYLDAGEIDAEPVTPDVLEAAVRRTVGGIRRILELRLGLRSPQVAPNPACGWCSARLTCEGALAWADRDLDR
jgi:hypothetical protein